MQSMVCGTYAARDYDLNRFSQSGLLCTDGNDGLVLWYFDEHSDLDFLSIVFENGDRPLSDWPWYIDRLRSFCIWVLLID